MFPDPLTNSPITHPHPSINMQIMHQDPLVSSSIDLANGNSADDFNFLDFFKDDFNEFDPLNIAGPGGALDTSGLADGMDFLMDTSADLNGDTEYGHKTKGKVVKKPAFATDNGNEGENKIGSSIAEKVAIKRKLASLHDEKIMLTGNISCLIRCRNDLRSR